MQGQAHNQQLQVEAGTAEEGSIPFVQQMQVRRVHLVSLHTCDSLDI